MARVQVQDLADAPKLQATIQSGGQYNVAVQKAGSNKLLDLAEALSKVNPMLRDATSVMRMRREERDFQREKGEQAFNENPEEALKQLKERRDKAKAGIRSLVNKGIFDEYSNPDFQAGILAARGKVQAKEFRRALLTDPEALNAKDPIAYAQEKVSEFYQGIDSAYTKASVAPLLQRTSDEYVNYVTKRQQDEAIAQGKLDWLGSIQDEAQAWASNKFNLEDESFKEWIDDGAGSFKGSHKYAFDNMFEPLIRDMVENGNTPGALRKIQELKNWKISKSGAKFANAELLDDLNELERTVLREGETFTQYAITAYNRQKDMAVEPLEAEFQQRLNDDMPITDVYFKDWASRTREELSSAGVKRNDVEKFIASQREEANKKYNRDAEDKIVTNPETYGEIRSALNLGIDQSKEIKRARDSGELGLTEYKELVKANADETEFEKTVLSRPIVRGYSDIIENRFSNVTVKGGLPIPGADNSTNIVKELMGAGPTDFAVPAVDLQTLGSSAEKIYKNALREERIKIIQSNPDISRPDLDRLIDERTEQIFATVDQKIEADTRSKLQTGIYNLGFKKMHVESALSGKATSGANKIAKALENLGIDPTEAIDFLNRYKNNHF